MRLGVVMMGEGAHAAAGAGVLEALEERGMTPHAVCGMQWGAWIAAMFASGLSAREIKQALIQTARLGRRLTAPAGGIFGIRAMGTGRRLERLLAAQAGQHVLSLCPRPAIIPCRMVRTGQRVLFTSRALFQETQAMLAMQASAGFAARAAMAAPPYLSPVQFMGSALLPETDLPLACRQLMMLDVHKILVIQPHASSGMQQDALDLSETAAYFCAGLPEEGEAGMLRIAMPAGALSFERMPECLHAGYRAAAQELDSLLGSMGMAHCRILSFRRRG